MAREVPGSKRQRDQLRATMLEQGCTLEQIAAVFAQQWGFRPRSAWRNAYGWTQEHVAGLYNQQLDNGQAPMNGKRIGDYENWPDSLVKPNLKVLHLLAKIYSTSAYKLVDSYDRQKMTADERITLEPPQHSGPTENRSLDSSEQFNQSQLPSTPFPGLVERLTQPPQPISDIVVSLSVGQNDTGSICELVTSAARESRQNSENAQGCVMPQSTLEEITAEVSRLTQERLYADPLIIFSDTVQVRDRIYQLLERRQYPSQTAHLYYLVSIVCALLANLSDGFGLPRAALEQTRASEAYAEIIGHNSLRLISRLLQACMAARGKRPQRALSLALSATRWATEPIAKASLHNRIASFSALTARPSEARAALAISFDAYESSTGESELFDRLGGPFGYPRAKLFQVSTETYLELGDLDHAENNAAETIRLHESLPTEQRAYDREAAAMINLAHTRLLRGDAEGAEEALRSVFELPPHRRLNWVVSTLNDFHVSLRNHSIVTSAVGRQLGQHIEQFSETTASNSFPSQSG